MPNLDWSLRDPTELEDLNPEEWELGFVDLLTDKKNSSIAEKLTLSRYASQTGGTIVELGSFRGGTMMPMAWRCKRDGVAAKLYAIDMFNRPHKVEGFVEAIHNADVEDMVTMLKGKTDTIAEIWTEPIDMLFIDAKHRYPYVYRDYYNYGFKHVKLGGILAFHDVHSVYVDRVIQDEVHPSSWKLLDHVNNLKVFRRIRTSLGPEDGPEDIKDQIKGDHHANI
jgi:predicted O-methyltransferase YrrM